jgi:hypothetical protein
MYVTGTIDPRWNNSVLNPAFRSLSASDFEVIQPGWRQVWRLSTIDAFYVVSSST